MSGLTQKWKALDILLCRQGTNVEHVTISANQSTSNMMACNVGVLANFHLVPKKKSFCFVSLGTVVGFSYCTACNKKTPVLEDSFWSVLTIPTSPHNWFLHLCAELLSHIVAAVFVTTLKLHAVDFELHAIQVEPCNVQWPFRSLSTMDVSVCLAYSDSHS